MQTWLHLNIRSPDSLRAWVEPATGRMKTLRTAALQHAEKEGFHCQAGMPSDTRYRLQGARLQELEHIA